MKRKSDNGKEKSEGSKRVTMDSQEISFLSDTPPFLSDSLTDCCQAEGPVASRERGEANGHISIAEGSTRGHADDRSGVRIQKARSKGDREGSGSASSKQSSRDSDRLSTVHWGSYDGRRRGGESGGEV